VTLNSETGLSHDFNCTFPRLTCSRGSVRFTRRNAVLHRSRVYRSVCSVFIPVISVIFFAYEFIILHVMSTF